MFTSKININSSGIRYLIGMVMVMVLITYDNSYIQLNYHMFTSNIRTIITVPNLYIYIFTFSILN